jgi:hypothetical protein
MKIFIALAVMLCVCSAAFAYSCQVDANGYVRCLKTKFGE